MASQMTNVPCSFCGDPTLPWWIESDEYVPGTICQRCFRDHAHQMTSHGLIAYLEHRVAEFKRSREAIAEHTGQPARGVHQHGDHMQVQLGPTGQFPTRGHPDDAGLDLYASSSMMVPSGQFRDIPCDIAVALPVGTWGMLTGRSSTLRKHGLMVAQGVIDAGYRGPLYTGVWNLGPEAVEVHRGWRISQLIVIANVTESVNLERVDELTPSERGNSGFGSTGV